MFAWFKIRLIAWFSSDTALETVRWIEAELASRGIGMDDPRFNPAIHALWYESLARRWWKIVDSREAH